MKIFDTKLYKLLFYSVCTTMFFFTSSLLYSQCTNSSAYGSGTINTAGGLVTISTCSFGGEYSTVSGAVSGQTLKFTSSGATDFITIHSGTYNGPVVAFGNSPLTFANTFTGTLYAHWNKSSACDSESSCRTTTVQCTSCGGGGPIVNDDCSGAIALTCGVTVTGNTSGAGVDAVPTCSGYSFTGPGLWYKLSNASGAVTLSLCGSGYDTKMGVFSGSCAALTCVIANDDFCSLQSQVSFTATLGTDYYVLVSGFSTSSGAFTLVPTCTQIIDPCNSISTTTCGTANTTTLTGAGVWSPAGCGYSTPGNEKIYSFTAPSTGVYAIQVTSATGSYVDYMFKNAALGCGPTGWSCISDIYFTGTYTMGTLTAGTTYYILLDGESTASTTHTFQINCPAADPCSSVIPISCGPSYTASQTGSGVWSPAACGYSTPGKETVYSFTAPATGAYSLAVTSTNFSFMDYMFKAASGGCSSTGWTCLQDVYSPVTLSLGTLTAGVQYYILLDPESTSLTTHTFNLICPAGAITVNCPLAVTVSCASLVPAVNIGSVSATTNCASPGITITFVSDVISSQTCTNKYTITRTYRATDLCGNSATCAQIITVNDITPPSITCPVAMTVSCASLVPAANPALVTATDNCTGTVTKTFVSDVISGQTCTNKYTLVRTYRATDACGNSSTCTQIITVNDVTPPTINCPANVTYACASQVPAANPASVSATDNCTGSVTVAFVSDVISGQTCNNKYTITRTYRATDACGNSATCAQTITVNDNIRPVLTGIPANITIECTQAVPSLPIVNATDNCAGAVNITFLETSTKTNYSSQCSAYSYLIYRTWTATDVCGNSSNGVQIITVQDTKPPTFISTPPAFITVECDDDDSNNLNPIAVDGCDNDPSVFLDIKYKFNLNGCVGSYLATYTWTAGDKCGNTAQFTQYISVVDTEAPVLKCPQDIEVSSELPIVVNWPQPKASDYCDGPITPIQIAGPPSGSIFLPGSKTLIKYQVTDLCGNVTTCSFYVRIRTGGGTLDNPDSPTNLEISTLNLQLNASSSVHGSTVLYQNEPNPFDNNTAIRFFLNNAENASLTIFDVNGKTIKLIEKEFSAGDNKVQLIDADFPSNGMYYYNLKTKDFNETKKMLYIK